MNFKIYHHYIKNLYFISILLISILPTGTLFGIPIKVPASFALIVVFMFTMYQYKIRIPTDIMLLISFILSILFMYTVLGTINFGYIALTEMKFILTILLLTVIVYIFHTKVFSKQLFFQIYSYTTFFIFLIKIAAYFYAYINGGGEKSGIAFYHLLFNFYPVSMDLPFGMFRLYLLTDIIAAFYPFVLSWAAKEKIVSNSFTAKIIMIASIFIVLTSFSRYLIAVSFIGIFLYAYTRKSLLKLIIGLLPFLFILLYQFHDAIITFIELRLFSHANEVSDNIRAEQSHALINFFFQSPYFGFGIGAYDIDYIRSAVHPFSYEKQILSFFPKVGLIGMLMLFFGFLYVIYRFLQKKNIIGLLSTLLFLLAGWFNPYLYASNVILIYAFIFIMLSNEQKPSIKKE